MIYLFNNNEEMIRIIPNSAIKRMYQTQTLTDENYISDRLEVEIQALNDEELSELEYMAIDDIENPQRFHYYFIVKETTERQTTSLTGVQSGIEELRKTPVYDMRPTNLSPKLIADRLLEGTNWQAGYTTDDVGTISTNFYYTDVFSALKKMCVAFGIEMQFFVEITTNRIGARYIEFRKRTGKSVGKRVVYGHNALKIVKEVEKTNTVTALIGRGKGVQVSESDEGNIGYGRKIGFENVEWKTSSGAPVDKPLGQEFVEIPELTLQYGIKNSNGTVRPKIGFVEFQDEESETRLIDRTYNALLELSRPQVLLETSSVYLPDTGIGDTINVVRHDRDLRYQTRVFEITWDRLANQAVDMKLGDRLGESENKRISRISNQVSGNISTELGPTIEELVDRLTSADGKNTNWYTDYDPMENPDTMGLVRVNDNWYQPDPEYEGEFILKQWNGEMWVEILRTSGNPELVRRFEEIEQQAQDLSDDIEASDQKADEAKETAGLAKSASESAEVIAQQAQAEAESAKSNSDEALDKAILAGTDAETAKQNALDAVSQVGEAKQSASEALGKAGEAVTRANEAFSQSDSARTQAEQALEEAGFAKEDARTASTNAQQAISDANEAKEKADAIPETINQTITERGLTTGTQVERWIDDATGEMRLAIADVSGQIPNYIMGVTWDKSENPKLIRTDYLQDYAELEDFELLSADYNVTKTGFSAELNSLSTKKLDTNQFTDFKTNEFDVTVEGFSGRISDVENKKLDDDVFNSFKTNDYEVTVGGFRTNIESLQTEKLDDTEFESFKSNEYSVTVDGIKSSLTHIEGVIPDFVVGVVWDKSENPKMKRTDYTEEMANLEDFESLTADYIQTVEGFSTDITAIKRDKLDNNTFESFKTNEFNVTVDGIDTKISSLETNKLDDAEFETFKTNVFDVTVDGLDGRIESVETNKLDDTEFESFKTNDYQVTVDGLSGDISRVETNKLDSTEFTSFKSNDYDVTVSGFQTALTDKLDEETFNTFKTNEFEMTVDGINGSIESLQTEKLDSADFNTFKSNDYEVTVDGLRMDLTSVSGSIPTIIMGVEWDKSQNPELTRTDYLEYDSPNLYSPSFIMGVRWDKTENPKLYRTDDTGGVDDYEYSQQTAQFTNDISGLSGRVTSVETNKLGTNEFNSFKTNTYAVDLAGLRTNITSLDEGKLGSDEFSDFKTNVFDVSVDGIGTEITNLQNNKLDDSEFESFKTNEFNVTVDGLTGRIGTVETEKLDSGTYETFKTNTYDVDVNGLKSRVSSVETKKLDSGTFETFRDTTYTNTIEGITGSISTLQEDKLDNNDFNSFKQNEYELTIDGLRMNLTEVTGASPTIVLGVEWDKSSEPTLERTDFSVGYADSDEFESLQADYNFTKSSWSTRLQQIENAGYATQSWSNQTFATPQSVSTQLQSYAKTTDLNGMVTETTLATKNFITAGSVSSLLTSYAKTGDVPTLTNFNLLKNSYDSMEQVIGTDKDSVARAVMTSRLWETEVSKVIDDELEQEYKLVEGDVPFFELTTSRSLLEGERSTAIYLPLDADNTVDGKRVVVDIQYEVTAGSKGNHASYIQYGDIKSSEPILYSSLNTARYHMFVPAGTRNGNILDLHTNIVNPVNYTWAKLTNITVSTIENTQVPINGTNTGAISSKITQLYDMINLSVLGKDGAMSRIAMGEEGIQIDGKLLHITAKTYIDDAVIKSAMIDTLDAGKITTGELNASLIRVVNLDANSIVGNEASFIKAMFESPHSVVTITSDRISARRSDGSQSVAMTNRGLEIIGPYGRTGSMQYGSDANRDRPSLFFNWERNHDLFMGVVNPTTNLAPPTMILRGAGNYGIEIHKLLMDGGSDYGIEISTVTTPSLGKNVVIYNQDRTGGIMIANGDLAYLTSGGWRSLNSWLT